ncbi:MAG: alpha/beta hydrolase [Thiohalocapsa sp.]|nr:alpha/beta hydrolase [Thiohalocapsa sp.]
MTWLLVSLAMFGALTGYSKIEAERLESRFPPVGDFSVVDGVRLHYSDTGPSDPDRPVVVLIHGASTSLLDFRDNLTGLLSRSFRVISIDRPGHGHSERADGEWPDPGEQARLIHDLLSALDVQSPILVGHSWAGSVVLAYLLAYPEQAAGGVLLAGGSHAWTGGVAWYNDLAGVPMLGPLFAYTLPMTAGRLALDSAIASVFAPNQAPPDYRERTGVELTLRPRTFMANAEDLRLLSSYLEHQSEFYGYIRHPLLLLTGDADEIVPPWNHAERLVRQAPNAELVVLENTGHALHHVRTDAVAALIESFGNRTRRTGVDPDPPSPGADR